MDTLTVADVARFLHCTPQTVRRYFRYPSGDPRRLPGRKIGRAWITTRRAFDEWLTDNE